MEQTQNTCKVAIKFRFTVGSCAGNNYSSWGTLNLIEQIATDKVKELIKTSGSNIVDVDIHSVTLL